jgi:TRAP transporter TAXI family solute receptor
MTPAEKIKVEDPANLMVKAATKVPPPRIDRSFKVQFQGDWGRTNLHRCLGCLGYELLRLSGPYTRFAIWNGRGQLDNLRAVGRGEVDVAFVVPEPFVRMAVEGLGPCAGEKYPLVRALGYVPQNDRLVMAVRKEFGIRSFEDLRRKKPKLRITLGPDDGVSLIGLGAKILLEESGASREQLAAWGGTLIEHDEPRAHTREMLDGNADAVITEAVMTGYWHEMAAKLDLDYLPIEPDVRERLHQELGLHTAILPKGYARGIDEDLEFLDFSHFLLVTTTALPDDIAYALAWSLVERWDTIEMQYRHIPPERSPVSYPIDPRASARPPIPLHPGAERYYRDARHL